MAPEASTGTSGEKATQMAGTYWPYESSVFQDKTRILIHIGRILGVTSWASFSRRRLLVSNEQGVGREWLSVDTAILFAFDEGYLQRGVVTVSTLPFDKPYDCYGWLVAGPAFVILVSEFRK